MKYLWLICGCFPIGLLMISCAAAPPEIAQPVLQSTAPYYTSAFPIIDISSKLEQIQKSTVRITATGTYRTYFFDEPDITLAHIDTMNVGDIAAGFNRFDETTAGTSILIGKNINRAYLITCAHTIQFPDTVVAYRRGEDIPEKTFVESVTLKQNQTNIAITESGLVNFNILDKNEREDLALIEINMDGLNDSNLQPIPISLGESKNLKSGSVVYVMGFPRGFPVVTQGMVSSTSRSRSGAFLTDALFNRGVSGGIIIASNNNFRDFEWVGMANAGAATNEYYLVPDTNQLDITETIQPYQGPVIAEKRSRLDYGLTYAIPTEAIAEFLNNHRNRLRRLNRNLNSAFQN